MKGENNSKCIDVNSRFSQPKSHICIEDLVFRRLKTEKGEKSNKTQSYDTFFKAISRAAFMWY